MYPVVEKLIARAIPLWDISLSKLKCLDKAQLNETTRIKCSGAKYTDHPEDLPEDQKPQQRPDESEESFWERYGEWEKSVKQYALPEPGEYRVWKNDISDCSDFSHDLRRDFATGLQIIVKLANIQLTPDKLSYDGGSWHVEGQVVFPPTANWTWLSC